jgi:hypothetical protein
MSDLPAWTRDILAAVPVRGEGLNRWLLRASIALRRCGRTASEITRTLECATASEPVRHGEIERAVKRSADYMKDDGAPRQSAPKWPTVDSDARAKIVAKHDGGAVELWERSPVRFDDDEPLTETIIDFLFPGNQLICAGMTSYDFATAPREQFRGTLSDHQLIVPSAMSNLTGIADKGTSTAHESAHCNDNTGRRQYLVVEQDAGTLDEQAGVLMHLADRAPLLLALRSGGKSLHGWFDCREQPEEIISRFFRYAVSLGADKALWTPCQFCRMPDGLRRRPDGSTARQSVLYWNPQLTEVAA